MDKTCSDIQHILTRYVVYKGEKQISKQFTEKDCCQFCKEQLGGGVFYCEYCGILDVSQLLELLFSNRIIIQAAQSATMGATISVGNVILEEPAAKTAPITCSNAPQLDLQSSPRNI